MVNGEKGRAKDFVTEKEFGDAEVHVEFCIPKHSNSGVYLMGCYEIQIYDSYGVEKDKYPGIECGGIYGRWINEKNVEGHSPRVNVSKPAGEWQSFDITFRAPRFDSSGEKVENAKSSSICAPSRPQKPTSKPSSLSSAIIRHTGQSSSMTMS